MQRTRTVTVLTVFMSPRTSCYKEKGNIIIQIFAIVFLYLAYITKTNKNVFRRAYIVWNAEQMSKTEFSLI